MNGTSTKGIGGARRWAIALAASGKDVVVREGARERESSGQYALPLATRPVAKPVAEIEKAVPAAEIAQEHFR